MDKTFVYHEGWNGRNGRTLDPCGLTVKERKTICDLGKGCVVSVRPPAFGRDREAPLFMTVDTVGCNLHCIFCYAMGPTWEFNSETWKDVIALHDSKETVKNLLHEITKGAREKDLRAEMTPKWRRWKKWIESSANNSGLGHYRLGCGRRI